MRRTPPAQTSLIRAAAASLAAILASLAAILLAAAPAAAQAPREMRPESRPDPGKDAGGKDAGGKDAGGKDRGAAEDSQKNRRASLDDLFTRLSAAKDEDEAKGIANLIQRRWSRSGSDTADLLLSRAQEAIKGSDHALAVELLDRVIALRPGWAEAWNLRASAFYLMDDTAASMADIRQVIEREPRHFAAIAGLGHIYMASGDKKRAIEAYRRALAIHPYLENIRKIVDRIQYEVDGRDI